MKKGLDLSGRVAKSLLAIIVVLVFVGLAVSPALGATKVFENRVTNVSIPVGDAFPVLPESICGVAGPFTGEIFFEVLQVVFWDNGRHVITTTNSVSLFDSAGNSVLRDRLMAENVRGSDTLPQSFTISLVSHCTPESATPGKLYQTQFTITVGEDGTIKQIHGALCDPTAYPFC